MYPGEQQERRTRGETHRREEELHRERERERAKAMAIQQKALKENPSPDNPKLCFFCLIPSETQARRERKRGQGILYEEERKKSTFHFHGLRWRKGDGEVKKKKNPPGKMLSVPSKRKDFRKSLIEN